MASRHQRVLLSAVSDQLLAWRQPSLARAVCLAVAVIVSAAATGSAIAAEAPDGWLDSKPIDPIELPRRAVKLDNIDTQDFELGAYGGLLSVEDFGVNGVQGLIGAYHVTEDFFLEGVYFRSTLGRTSFERLSGGADLLTEKQRDRKSVV